MKIARCAAPLWLGAVLLTAAPARADDPPPAAPGRSLTDSLEAAGSLAQMPWEGQFYQVLETGTDGPSFIRYAPSAKDGVADGWLVEAYLKSKPRRGGDAAYVAGYFRFDCKSGKGAVVSLVEYDREGQEVSRNDTRSQADFARKSPLWILMRASCKGARPKGPILLGMGAVLDELSRTAVQGNSRR